MLKTLTGVFVLIAALAGCAPMQPAADSQSVRIEGTPGMSVIYLVRSNPDLSDLQPQVYIDDRLLGSSFVGTYYRIEVPAGRHRFSGFGVDGGRLTIDTQANGVYFVQHRVAGSRLTWQSPSSSYQIIDEARARAVMAGAQRAG